jgi:alpha-glucosidase
MLLLTLRGTPTIYYGDEIGMENGDIPPDRIQDPWEKMTSGLNLGRDPQRTPMQWNNSENAGFCPADVEAWLPVATNYQQVNVKTERANPNTMLNLTRQLIALRRRSNALSLGSIRVMVVKEPVFAYVREEGNEKFLIVLNFSDQKQAISLPIDLGLPQPLISTIGEPPAVDTLANFDLRGDEGMVISLEQT